MIPGRASVAPQRAAVDFKVRGRFHVASAVAGMFASAAWSVIVLSKDSADIAGAAWWTLSSLAVLSAVAILGGALQRAKISSPALDRCCTVLPIALAIAWIEVTGSLSSSLLGLPVLLIVANCVTGDIRAGVLSWAVASVAHVGVVWAERAHFLRYASASAWMGIRESDAPPPLVSIVGILCVYGAALWFGREFAKPGRRRANQLHRWLRNREPLGGKYRLGRGNGRGGMGRVYAAFRISDGKPVAIKLLHPHLAEIPEALARFRQEAKTVSRLPATCVARVLDVGRAKEGHYIAMNLLDGEDLATRMRRNGRLPIGETIQVVEQIAVVLNAAARIGIVHRDVLATFS